MKAVPYGLLADVDVSSHPQLPLNDAGRGCSCLQGLSFNETIFTWSCLLRSTRSASFMDPPRGCEALNQSDNDRDGHLKSPGHFSLGNTILEPCNSSSPIQLAQFSSWRHCQIRPNTGGMFSYKAKQETASHT